VTTLQCEIGLKTKILVFPLLISSLAFGGEVRDTFILGCNLPWLDGRMGWDVAYKPEWGCGFDEAKVDRYFADMHRMGAKVVRWWLLADMRGGVIFDEDESAHSLKQVTPRPAAS